MENLNPNTKRIAIIGGGAAGCICAYFLSKENLDVSIFDKKGFLTTLLPTGGGRCNLAHAIYDFKELASNYPRGEKFLYSVFSKFSTNDTIKMFEEIGIKTYTQEDGRIFPESNSAKDVRTKILNNLDKAQFIKENVISIQKTNSEFKIKTSNAEYLFTDIVIATGGHSGYEMLKNLNIKIIPPKPSLVGLNTKEDFKNISGTTIQNVGFENMQDTVLFTHFGVSGPLIYKISSIKAFNEFPYIITLDLYPQDFDLQKLLNSNPHKKIKNVLSEILPHKIIPIILKEIPTTQKAHMINGKTRDLILDRIHNFEVEIIGTNKGEETVSAGGIDLNEINPKTMEVKNIQNLYCIGEILNIDGFCGGFNLQNAWSTAYIAAQNIINKY